MTRRRRPAAKALKDSTALTPPGAPVAEATPPAAGPAEPTVTLSAPLAAAVRDLLAQMPSGQVAGLFLAYVNAVEPQLQALQAQQAKVG